MSARGMPPLRWASMSCRSSGSVHAGQRIGILGANGQGKSTLVKTIARALAPIRGDVTEGKGLNIGYFAQQELDVLRPQDTPLEHMTRLAKETIAAGRSGYVAGREQELRNYLGTFNFSNDMVTPDRSESTPPREASTSGAAALSTCARKTTAIIASPPAARRPPPPR